MKRALIGLVTALLSTFAIVPAVTALAAPAPVIETSSTSLTEVFKETFDTPMSTGAWAGSYYDKRFKTYNGLPDNGTGPGRYSTTGMAAHDGVMEMFGHRAQDANGNWAPVTSALIPKFPGAPDYTSRLKYARYEIAINYTPSKGRTIFPQSDMTGWQFAVLLWPDTGKWSDGEVDFPEGTPGQREFWFLHFLGSRAKDNCAGGWVFNSKLMVGYHTYVIDWQSTGFTFKRDGLVVAQNNCLVPPGNMHPVIQLSALGRDVTPNSFGSVQIDRFAAYKRG